MHTLPQAPQWEASLAVLTHDAPQSVWPGGQTIWQRPSVQVWPALHAVPQAPQLRGSRWTSRHAPSQKA